MFIAASATILLELVLYSKHGTYYTSLGDKMRKVHVSKARMTLDKTKLKTSQKMFWLGGLDILIVILFVVSFSVLYLSLTSLYQTKVGVASERYQRTE